MSLFDFSVQNTIEFASQFAQVFFACGALVIGIYWLARYAGYKPQPAKRRSKKQALRPMSSTPLTPLASVRVLEPWEAALLHVDEARDCQATASELAGSAEYMIKRLREDIKALDMALPDREPAPLVSAKSDAASLAA